ncbi:carnitine racemase [Mycolicibacterium fortuitum]|uniref:carnitine racemase n=1 Tax=Mycolicibacterium fortuitum TaxID=1766 RepID=UPI002623DA6D|nr:carnitine racemase [Mycolicibacterium fortuitum]
MTTTETTTAIDAAVSSLVHVLAGGLDAEALRAAVQQALLHAEVEDGAVLVPINGRAHLLADPVEGEVWAGEAVGNAADSLQYGIAHVAAAIVAGAHL